MPKYIVNDDTYVLTGYELVQIAIAVADGKEIYTVLVDFVNSCERIVY